MLKGKCNCGQVAFTIQADNNDIYQCHCSICRKGSGVHGMAVLVVRKTELKWIPKNRTHQNLAKAWP